VHAPPVLLLHALGTSLAVWRAQLAVLEASFRVIRYDVRGHGQSVRPTGSAADCSIMELVADALAVLDAARIERADWCGVSLGGMTAMAAAVSHPERVRRLVLANTSAHLGAREALDGRIAAIQTRGIDAAIDGLAERWFTPEFRAADPDTVEQILAIVRGTDPLGYIDACAAVRDLDLREAIGAIQAPALVIAGARDLSTPIEHALDITDRIASTRYEVLDASHLSNVEQADDFNGAALAFLRDY